MQQITPTHTQSNENEYMYTISTTVEAKIKTLQWMHGMYGMAYTYVKYNESQENIDKKISICFN